MKFVSKLFIFMLAFGLWVTSPLAQTQDVKSSKDHPLITRYPGSTIIRYIFREFDSFPLPLGRIVGAANKPEKSQTLEGKITHIVYRMPEGRSVLEVYRNFEQALQRAGFQTLFTCVNDACVSSFRHVQFLTGVNDVWEGPAATGQRYLACKLAQPGGDVYVSLNVQFARTEVGLYVIEMKPMEAGLVSVNAETLAGDIQRTGHVAVYGIYFDTGKADIKPESEATLKEIAKLLQQNAALKVHVVGHTDSVGSFASNIELSRRRAASVAQALTTTYKIPAAQLHAEGVGPLVPVASNKSEDGRAKNRRVELVEQ